MSFACYKFLQIPTNFSLGFNGHMQQLFEPASNTTIFIETTVIVSIIFYGGLLLWIV